MVETFHEVDYRCYEILKIAAVADEDGEFYCLSAMCSPKVLVGVKGDTVEVDDVGRVVTNLVALNVVVAAAVFASRWEHLKLCGIKFAFYDSCQHMRRTKQMENLDCC